MYFEVIVINNLEKKVPFITNYLFDDISSIYFFALIIQFVYSHDMLV